MSHRCVTLLCSELLLTVEIVMIHLHLLQTFTLIAWSQITSCVSISNTLLNQDSAEVVAHYLSSKDYLPNENELSKMIPKKDKLDSEDTFILSKLTDGEILKLLNENPKRDEFTLNDVLNVAESESDTLVKKNKPQKVEEPIKREPQMPVFKLNHKDVDRFAFNADGDPKYNAYQTINNILYSHPRETNSEETEDNKEMIFDVLVAQLKSLCCKKSKPKKTNNKLKLVMETFFKRLYEKKQAVKNRASINGLGLTKEYIFLVVNDEIKTNNVSDDNELIQVDPDSLSKNSSVLLLGPLTTPLNEIELGSVIKRISGEISQPEYLPLLEKLSKGSLGGNLGLKNSLITGPQTRRYIKPHRCNHKTPSTRIYGGPKWLICSGYLNLNTPSLYD